RTSIEHFAVCLERDAVLFRSLVKQRGIGGEVQQRGGYFLDFRHPVVHEIKASFFIRGLRIFGILDPPNEPIAQLKLHLAHVQNISAIYLRRARERKDAIDRKSGALVDRKSVV